jgi:hypothetical protein
MSKQMSKQNFKEKPQRSLFCKLRALHSIRFRVGYHAVEANQDQRAAMR